MPTNIQTLSFILLISDFQSDSYKTGILKSELYSSLENIQIIDVTHQIRLNNTIEAAFIHKQIQLPENQSNIIITKVGSTKDIIVYQQLLNLYIFPNNGLLSMVFESIDQDKTYILPWGQEKEAITAFIEKRLHTLPKAGEKRIMRLNKTAQISQDIATAECIYTDGHGNCYFNINEDQFQGFLKGRNFSIRIQHYTGHSFRNIGRHITDAGPGEALFKFSRSGYLKLQINQGNAKQLFRIKDDTKIIIEIQ